MNTRLRAYALTAVLAAAAALPPSAARAGGRGADLTATGLKVTLEGSSTLHPWKATALSATLTARVEESGKGLERDLAGGGLKALDLEVAVDSLKSTETAGMDRNMHKDLGADQYPRITFQLKDYRIKGGQVLADGTLSIHGVSRPVELAGTLKRVGAALEVSGSAPLRMTDYGVKPPVMMFGTIKVADAVTVAYSFVLAE